METAHITIIALGALLALCIGLLNNEHETDTVNEFRAGLRAALRRSN